MNTKTTLWALAASIAAFAVVAGLSHAGEGTAERRKQRSADEAAAMAAYLIRTGGEDEVRTVTDGTATTLERPVSVDLVRQRFGEPDWTAKSAGGFVPKERVQGERWGYGRLLLFVKDGAVLQFTQSSRSVQEPPGAPHTSGSVEASPKPVEPVTKPVTPPPETTVRTPQSVASVETPAKAQRSGKSRLPRLTNVLSGRHEVRVRNPNAYTVYAGVRDGGAGGNFEVPPNGVASTYMPDGEYDMYFVRSDKPSTLFRGDRIRLHGNGVEITLVAIENGNYAIQEVPGEE